MSLTFENLYLVLLFVVAIIAIFWNRISRFISKYVSTSQLNSSLLLSYYTQSASGPALVPLTAVISEVLPSGAGHIRLLKSSDMHCIDIVYLNFTTQIRLLAVPTKGTERLNPTIRGSLMKSVQLEGDFPSYFSLYTNKGNDAQARYILDPKAMGHVIDFCKSYSWELVNNELIFVSKSGIDNESIEKFLAEIQPAVEISDETVDSQMKSDFKNQFFRNFNCPLCGTKTEKKNQGYICPKGHGRLITGRELREMSKNVFDGVEMPNDTKQIINCPNCNNPMVKVRYRASTIIDSCINCPYRWLDAGELEKNISQ